MFSNCTSWTFQIEIFLYFYNRVANVHTSHLLPPHSGPESLRSLPTLLLEMLLLVPGEVHQVPQQERLHHGEPIQLWFTWSTHPFGLLTSHASACSSDRRLWEELLRFSQKRFSASDEEHHQVS